MNSRLLRISAAAASVVAGGMLLAPAVMAEGEGGSGVTCTITDNGAFSYNKCRIKVVNKTTTIQVNKARVKNNVGVVSNTGGNKASFNTGGDVTVTSGDSTVTVTITNTVNGNTINP